MNRKMRNFCIGRIRMLFQVTRLRRNSGYLLAEVLVASCALIVGILIILNMFAIMRKNVTLERGRLNALNEARRKIEYIRSLSYEEIGVGVSSSNPAYIGHYETDFENPEYNEGIDLYFSDSVLLGNGIIGQRWVTVEPVDDAVDGIGGADDDGNTTDYKKVTAVIAWNEKSGPMEVSVGTIISGVDEGVIGGGGTSDMKVNKKKEKSGMGTMGMGGMTHSGSLEDPDKKDDPTTDPDNTGDELKYPQDSDRKDHHPGTTNESYWKYNPADGTPMYDPE